MAEFAPPPKSPPEPDPDAEASAPEPAAAPPVLAQPPYVRPAPAPAPGSHLASTLGVIGVILLLVNGAFIFLSQNYFAGKPLDAAALNPVRMAFAISSVVVGATAFASSLQPRLVGHVLSSLAAVAALAGGVESLSHGMPPVLGLTLLLVGGLLGVLTFMSWDKHSRVAWSFLSSLVIVFALVTFFGAPKVRNMLHIGLWYAMMIPGLLTVCAVSLGLIRFEYRDQMPSQKSQSASR